MNRWLARNLLAGAMAVVCGGAISRADAPSAKLAAPDAETRTRELRMVDDVYKDQIAKAHTDVEKTALANDLIRQAGEVKEKAAEQYAIYSKAGDVAAQAGAVMTAFVALDMIAQRFDVDSLLMQIDMLGKLSGNLKQTSEQKAFIDRCAVVMDEAVARERYDLIKRIGDLELSAVRKYGDAASTKAASARISETHLARIAFDQQKAALATLGHNPADPEANLIVGKYHCFIRDDWKSGLPLLAQGSDALLKALAKQDLAAGSDAQAKSVVADGWWDKAAKERGIAQRHIFHRAAALYTEVLPALSGLAKTRAEKRTASLADSNGFSSRAMTLGEVLARFTFPNKSFHIEGDAITGKAENFDDYSTYAWLENPETMHAFEYGISIKAKSYVAAVVDIDGNKYRFTHAFQGVDDNMIDGKGKKGERFPTGPKGANGWSSIKAVLEQDKVTFSYNGAVIGSVDLQTPTTPATKIKVGFSSHNQPISVKDIYLAEK